ncbi:6145_t:CDS:10 [Paraglomus occultum]|uniref:Nicotinamide phosphoribosyltransferase n=1 Tax=Paraglomus occultum TaxID=144539 RepID=A0A9N9BMK8_9GLOM|nr:6145_t:CDS:10 [Paraglomus occultum]
MSGPFGIPLGVLTDSYKASHAFLYPQTVKTVAYGEFRAGYERDRDDTRLVFYGIRFVIENYIAKKWTIEDVDYAEQFYATHNANNTPFPYPRELFLKFINENEGYFPVKIEALPEGTVCHAHTPVYQITAEKEYAPLVTFLETLLTMVWYPTTVATLSRRAKDLIQQAYDETVDEDGYASLESRLHDFGFRGCTCLEQSIIGGSAHLLNFTGTDTMSAAYYVQFNLNNGKPVASSIPATEHSIMTAHKTERAAIMQMIEKFGSGVFACVMDSYDYANALEKVLPSVASAKVGKGGFMVLRPDSGDQAEVVLMALRKADEVFGSYVNKKGYKVIRGCGVIQGDGVTTTTLKRIISTVKDAGYSLQNVSYGMGGGLLQKLNRDTMSFATKLSHITYKDGTARDVMKTPKTDGSKFSLPGELMVARNADWVPIVYPKDTPSIPSESNLLKLVYNYGKLCPWETFDDVRKRVADQWSRTPKHYDNISPALKEKIRKMVESKKSADELQLGN